MWPVAREMGACILPFIVVLIVCLMIKCKNRNFE